jgi:aminomethyltransferase
MPLYGHEMDETYGVIETGLGFGMSKSRFERADILGFGRIVEEKAAKANMTSGRIRVGLKSLSGPPAREGASILDNDGLKIGHVTSGVPSPILGFNIAMGYVPSQHSGVGTKVKLEIRSKLYDAEIMALPFVTPPYHRRLKA